MSGGIAKFCLACGAPLAGSATTARATTAVAPADQPPARPWWTKPPPAARMSLLCVAWLPIAIMALPLLAAIVGMEQLHWPANLGFLVVLTTVYFGPFVLGIILGVRSLATGTERRAGIAGIAINLGIVVVSLVLLTLEVAAG